MVRPLTLGAVAVIAGGLLVTTPSAASAAPQALCSQKGKVVDAQLKGDATVNATALLSTIRNCTSMAQTYKSFASIDYPAKTSCPADVTNVPEGSMTLKAKQTDKASTPFGKSGSCTGTYVVTLTLKQKGNVLDTASVSLKYT